MKVRHSKRIRRYSPSLPFWAYSSYNKRGGKAHPVVIRRRNMILDMWASMHTYDEIAKALDIDINTVTRYIIRAKVQGDPRAERVVESKYALRASLRRRQIAMLAEIGVPVPEIAERLGCTVRLVQKRIKEAG